MSARRGSLGKYEPMHQLLRRTAMGPGPGSYSPRPPKVKGGTFSKVLKPILDQPTYFAVVTNRCGACLVCTGAQILYS